jgi:hypothetical protein
LLFFFFAKAWGQAYISLLREFVGRGVLSLLPEIVSSKVAVREQIDRNFGNQHIGNRLPMR